MKRARACPLGTLILSASVLGLVLYPNAGMGAEPAQDAQADELSTSQASLERAFEGDPSALSREVLPRTGFGVQPFPLVFASPETSIGVGGGLVMTYRERDLSPDARPHSVSTLAAYTLNQQALMVLQPVAYFWKRRVETRGDLIYRRWPAQFFGIGNQTRKRDREDFSSDEWYFMPWATVQVWKGLRVGGSYTLRTSQLLKFEEGGAVAQMSDSGRAGGVRSGLGLILDWDDRDHAFYPGSGGWHRVQWTVSRREFGSDFNQDEWRFDFRQFVTLVNSHILAFRWFSMLRSGELGLFDYVPVRIRGVFAGRFQDRVMTSFESEYRFPVWKRVGGALFFGFGSVAERIPGLFSSSLHLAGGAGIRFALDPLERINLRFDLGVGEDGVYPYLQIQEAF